MDDDASLVEAIRGGDQSAWSELVNRHSQVVWRLARSVVDDDDMATDAMQTAWLALLQHIDRIERPQAVLSWLMTTVRREAIALSNSLARQRAEDPLEWSFDLATPSESDPAAQTEDADQNRLVLRALRTLSTRCQQLLTLLAHRTDYDTIASTMEMAIGSIGPTRSRCLEQLRRVPAIASLEAAR